MNLEKAIEELSHISNGDNPLIKYDIDYALKLGIEALKDKASYRKRYPRSPISLLPGETEE